MGLILVTTQHGAFLVGVIIVYIMAWVSEFLSFEWSCWFSVSRLLSVCYLEIKCEHTLSWFCSVRISAEGIVAQASNICTQIGSPSWYAYSLSYLMSNLYNLWCLWLWAQVLARIKTNKGIDPILGSYYEILSPKKKLGGWWFWWEWGGMCILVHKSPQRLAKLSGEKLY